MNIGGEEEYLHPFLTHVLDGGEWLGLRLGHFTSHSHTGRFEEEKHLLPEPGSKPGPSSPYSIPWLISNLMHKILIYLQIVPCEVASLPSGAFPGGGYGIAHQIRWVPGK
jgi:hypothetical protein